MPEEKYVVIIERNAVDKSLVQHVHFYLYEHDRSEWSAVSEALLQRGIPFDMQLWDVNKLGKLLIEARAT